jgi:hypothetical protein
VKKIFCLVVAMMLLGSFSAYAKIIFVGSHGGVATYLHVSSDGWYADPLKGNEDIVNGSSMEKIREVAIGENGNKNSNGVDASIALVRARTDYEIKARVYNETGNVTDAFNWIKSVYEEGDGIFLVGYSAGGKFVLNLSSLLDFHDFQVQYMGLIDPVIWINNFRISDNVKVVDSYIQRHDSLWDAIFDPQFQGCYAFLYDHEKTDYYDYTITGSDGNGDDIDHMNIDNQEIIWGNIGNNMLFLLGMSPSEIEGGDVDIEESSSDGIAKDINELTEEEWQEIEQESQDSNSGDTSDPNPGTTDPTPDIDVHIDKVTASYQGEEDYQHVTNIYLGEEVRMEVDIENKGDEDIHVDIEYYRDDDKSFSFSDSHKVGEDNDVKIDHGTRDNGQPENVIEHKQHITFPAVGTYYLYIKVTTNGDSDESASSNTREYAKIIVSEFLEEPAPVTQPTGKTWNELTSGEKAAVLQIILD